MEELAALVEALLMILFVGGLSLLAQWGRKNQGAEISLIVILLFVSFLVTAVGALVAIMGWSNTVSSDVSPGLAVGSAFTLVLAGLAGLALCISPLRKLTGQHLKGVGYESFAPAESNPIERSFEGWWSDPPVFF